jgi:hypothetical protein
MKDAETRMKTCMKRGDEQENLGQQREVWPILRSAKGVVCEMKKKLCKSCWCILGGASLALILLSV